MGAAALPYLVVAPPKVVTAVAKCLQLGVSVRISDSASTGVCPLFVVNPGRSSPLAWSFNQQSVVLLVVAKLASTGFLFSSAARPLCIAGHR